MTTFLLCNFTKSLKDTDVCTQYTLVCIEAWVITSLFLSSQSLTLEPSSKLQLRFQVSQLLLTGYRPLVKTR